MESREQLRREILKAFDGGFRSVRRPLLYRFVVAVVALVTVLLPVGYGVLVAWGCLSILRVLLQMIAALDGSVLLTSLVVASLLLSVVVLLITLKPLLAGPSRLRPNRSIQACDETLLFSFVEQICQAINAPQPTSIEVNLPPNCSAGCRGCSANDSY